MKEVKCPTGAVLKVHPAPFAASKALYQSLLRELRDIPISSKTELASIFKDAICSGFSSEDVEKKLWECLKRCTYDSGKGDLKIDEGTFEPVKAREDYLFVCTEVAIENIYPFVKSLYAEYQRLMSMFDSTQV